MAPPEFVSWLPLSDAEHSMKGPSVEKDACAEILVWRVHVVDEVLGSGRDLQRVFYHYIRLKVFDEKGKESASTVDLNYREPGAILDVAGRTIKPDGTVIDLDKKTIFKKDLVRAGRAREKAVSFAMPGVEPGAIIEYRWRQTENDNRFRYVRLKFQRDFPVQNVTYFVKPLSSEYIGVEQMFLMHFNCDPSPIKQERDGYNSTTLTNVAASRHEPYAPSDPNIEPWALLYYHEGAVKDAEKFWNGEGKKVYNDLKGSLKASDELKSAAAEATAGVSKDEEKIAILVSYLRKKVRNLFDPAVTSAERDKFFEKLPKDRNRTSAEVFKSGIAMPSEMNVAFAALAMQAGLDVRPALVANRGEYLFNPKLTDRYFLDDTAMAVKLGDSWRVLDISRRFVMPGMLPWENESMFALIADPKAPMFIQTPAAPPEASAERRTARLKLSDLGTLAGDVEETYTGHRAEQLREDLDEKSPAQQEEWLRDRIIRIFPDAELKNIHLQNVDDASKPLVTRYQLEAPRYAQVTGKRVLFQPSAFRRGQASPFSATDRRLPVNFPFAWQEVDDVHITLPEGFSLDNADSPGSLDFGEPGTYTLEMRIRNGASPEIQVSREFTMGKKGFLFFQPTTYPTLKKVFDEIQVRDAHTVSLKGD